MAMFLETQSGIVSLEHVIAIDEVPQTEMLTVYLVGGLIRQCTMRQLATVMRPTAATNEKSAPTGAQSTLLSESKL